jgi:putative aminopeptidase FrvX
MWDIPACRVQGDRLYSRACDDLIGCVSILSLLDELHRRKVHKKVTAVFTAATRSGLAGGQTPVCSSASSGERPDDCD